MSMGEPGWRNHHPARLGLHAALLVVKVGLSPLVDRVQEKHEQQDSVQRLAILLAGVTFRMPMMALNRGSS